MAKKEEFDFFPNDQIDQWWYEHSTELREQIDEETLRLRQRVRKLEEEKDSLSSKLALAVRIIRRAREALRINEGR
jgi:hypothetical protein